MRKRIFTALMGIMISIAAFAATKASYPGGDEAMRKYLSTNMKYPAPSKANGVEGVVVVLTTINPDGTIGTLKIQRMVDPDLEQEAIRLVKNMPKWTPATDDSGAAVASQVPVSVAFELSTEE